MPDFLRRLSRSETARMLSCGMIAVAVTWGFAALWVFIAKGGM